MLRQYSPIQDFDFKDDNHIGSDTVKHPESFLVTRIREYNALLLELTKPDTANPLDELHIKRIEGIGKILDSLKRGLEAELLIESAMIRNK